MAKEGSGQIPNGSGGDGSGGLGCLEVGSTPREGCAVLETGACDSEQLLGTWPPWEHLMTVPEFHFPGLAESMSVIAGTEVQSLISHPRGVRAEEDLAMRGGYQTDSLNSCSSEIQM